VLTSAIGARNINNELRYPDLRHYLPRGLGREERNKTGRHIMETQVEK